MLLLRLIVISMFMDLEIYFESKDFDLLVPIERFEHNFFAEVSKISKMILLAV
jgi:hypothetical protein